MLKPLLNFFDKVQEESGEGGEAEEEVEEKPKITVRTASHFDVDSDLYGMSELLRE